MATTTKADRRSELKLTMDFRLTSITHKAGMAVIAAGLIAVYSFWAVQSFRVSSLAGSIDPQQLRRAIELDPSNAPPYHALGIIDLFQKQDFKAAHDHFQDAASRDPYSARYWADLALAEMMLGDEEGRRRALQRALEAEPTQTEIVWEMANLELVSGSTQSALRHMRLVAEHEPRRAAAALELSWKATGDITTVLDNAVPKTAEAHLLLLGIAIENRNAPAAALVWDRLLAFGKPISAKEALVYVNFLLRTGNGPEAVKAWNQLAAVVPGLSEYTQPGNLVKNPGFEMPLLNSGLDWRFTSQPGVLESVDTSEFHSGASSFRLEFDDTAGAVPDLRQIIPVEAGGQYTLALAYKAEAFSGADLKLELTDYATNATIVKLEAFHNATTWTESSSTFSVPPNVRMLQLGFESRGVPKGTLWIDDVKLEAH